MITFQFQRRYDFLLLTNGAFKLQTELFDVRFCRGRAVSATERFGPEIVTTREGARKLVYRFRRFEQSASEIRAGERGREEEAEQAGVLEVREQDRDREDNFVRDGRILDGTYC